MTMADEDANRSPPRARLAALDAARRDPEKRRVRDLTTTISAGNRAYQAVIGVEKEKGKYSKAEVERFTTAFLAAFSADCGIRLKPRLRFCVLEALTETRVHPQLCLVEVGDGRCTLSFDEKLLDSRGHRRRPDICREKLGFARRA